MRRAFQLGARGAEGIVKQERLRNIRPFAEERDELPVAVATWADAATEGGCSGCDERGRIAVLRARSTLFRLCARCLNNVNRCLGAMR
jgi:hypothetical protein